MSVVDVYKFIKRNHFEGMIDFVIKHNIVNYAMISATGDFIEKNNNRYYVVYICNGLTKTFAEENINVKKSIFTKFVKKPLETICKVIKKNDKYLIKIRYKLFFNNDIIENFLFDDIIKDFLEYTHTDSIEKLDRLILQAQEISRELMMRAS